MISDVLKNYILNKNLIEYKHYDIETLNKLDKYIVENNITALQDKLVVINDDDFMDYYNDCFQKSRENYVIELDFGEIYSKEPIIYDMIYNIINDDEEVNNIIRCDSCEYIYLFYN